MALRAKVDLDPPHLAALFSTVRATKPVMGITWEAAARMGNWLIGKGHSHVVDGFKMISFAQTLRYRMRADAIHRARVWMLTATGVETANFQPAPGTATVVIEGVTHHLDLSDVASTTIYPVVYAASSSEIEVALTVTPVTSAFAVNFHHISLFDVPLQDLTATNGVIDSSCQSGNPIYDGSAANEALAGVHDIAELARSTYLRRGCLFSWATGSPVFTLLTTFQNIFQRAPVMQARCMNQVSNATRIVRFAAYAQTSAGTGEVRAVMSSGGTATLTITTTAQWVTGNLTITTDDPNAWDSNRGIRGGRDTCTFSYRHTTGGGALINLYRICVFELPGA